MKWLGEAQREGLCRPDKRKRHRAVQRRCRVAATPYPAYERRGFNTYAR